MAKSQLHQQIAEMRQSLLDEGILNEYFLQLETIEETEPNFVKNIIGTYFTQSTLYLEELEDTFERKPLKLATVERLIQKLRGGSASIGAGKFNAIVVEMWNVFKNRNFGGLYAAFENVKAEHAILRSQLEPYAELLHQLSEEVPPDEVSDNHGGDVDAESIDSNDMND